MRMFIYLSITMKCLYENIEVQVVYGPDGKNIVYLIIDSCGILRYWKLTMGCERCGWSLYGTKVSG